MNSSPRSTITNGDLRGACGPVSRWVGVVISQRVPVSELAVRDVIVFRNPNKPSEEMVHRIVQITKGSDGQLLITQGDATRSRPDANHSRKLCLQSALVPAPARIRSCGLPKSSGNCLAGRRARLDSGGSQHCDQTAPGCQSTSREGWGDVLRVTRTSSSHQPKNNSSRSVPGERIV